jgi:hypothetical protein
MYKLNEKINAAIRLLKTSVIVSKVIGGKRMQVILNIIAITRLQRTF